MNMDPIGNAFGMNTMQMGAFDKQTFGAQVVTQTLNNMNTNMFGSGGVNADYDFQTKVLMAGAVGKGMNLDMKV